MKESETENVTKCISQEDKLQTYETLLSCALQSKRVDILCSWFEVAPTSYANDADHTRFCLRHHFQLAQTSNI